MENKWISVKDGLPKKSGYVICHKYNGLVVPLFFAAESEHKDVATGFHYNGIDQNGQIAHWQPLPEPPNQLKD